MKWASHGRPRFRSRWASVSITNAVGAVATVTSDRSWNVPLSAAPDDVNAVPTVAGPSGASIDSSLNVWLLARSPDQSRWFRRSEIVSYTTCGGAADTADVCVTYPSGRSAFAIGGGYEGEPPRGRRTWSS